MEPRGSVAFVTGANRGIGRAIVEALASAGASRIYAAARDVRQLEPLLKAHRAIVVPVTLDVTNRASVAVAAAGAPDVDLLINNAGVAEGGGVVRADGLVSARSEMEVNYFGLLAMSQAFAPIVRANAPGAIVNVLSILSLMGAPSVATYSASKAAALSATRALRAELAGSRIQVLGVMPGYVDTDMTKGMAVEKIAAEDVAAALIDGLRSGAEDVYPGEMASMLARAYAADAKAVERQMATFGATPAVAGG